jgi:hypothetical protein
LAFSSACNAFRSGASRSAINASRSGRLRSAGWLAAHAFASMLRRRGSHPLREPFEKRGLGRRGNAGSGHIAPGGDNRRKELAVSSAWKNRPGSQVLRPRNITVFRVYEGFDQAALLTSRRRERFAIGRIRRPMRPPNLRRQPGRRRGADAHDGVRLRAQDPWRGYRPPGRDIVSVRLPPQLSRDPARSRRFWLAIVIAPTGRPSRVASSMAASIWAIR